MKTLLRKLDRKEVSLIKRGVGQNSIVILRIQCAMELFSEENIEMFKQAILMWKRTHKFLSSRIVKTNQFDYYFEYIDDEDESYMFENVRFLRLENHKNVSRHVYKTVSDFLFEHCLSDEINPDKNAERLLWNMYLFEFDRENRVYDMIVNHHHTISQGFSTVNSLFTLLRIFESIYKNEFIELNENVVFPGCENLFAFKKPLNGELGVKTYRLKVPSFINRQRAKAASLSQKPPEYLDMHSSIMNVETSEIFETMERLFDVSRMNHVKFKVFYLEAELFSKLILKCKAEGAKINGCLEVLTSLAFLEWHRKHSTLDDDELEQICYFIIVDLRKYVDKGEIDEATLGLCTGGLLAYPDMNELNRIGYDPSNVNKYFWPLVRETSEQLHERLRSDNTKFFPRLYAPERDDLYYHFFISNIGLPPNPHYFDLIKLNSEDCFGISTFDATILKRLFQFYAIMGTNGELKYFVNYNSHFIDSYLIDDFIEIFNSIVHHVLKYSDFLNI